MKVRNGETITLGKEVELYIPYQKITIYEEEHNKANSREVLFENRGPAKVEVKGDQMIIKTAGATLTYPASEKYPAGDYAC